MHEMGDHAGSGESEVHSGEQQRASARVDEVDFGGNTLAAYIQRHRVEEEEAGKPRNMLMMHA